MTCSRQVFFIPITLASLAWPTTTGAYEPKALGALADAPATYWAHQSAFVSLVSHCIIRTKGPATCTPTVLLCPVLAFPKLLYSLPLSLSLVTLHAPAPIPFLLDFHHPGQHAACSGCGWWLVPSPSLTFPFIPSNLGRVSLSFLPFLVLHRIPLSAHLG